MNSTTENLGGAIDQNGGTPAGALWNATNFSVIVLLLTCLYFLLRRDPKIYGKFRAFPGPSEIPIFGSLHHLLRPHNEYLSYFDNWFETMRPVGKIWMGPWLPYILLFDPVGAEKVMSSMNHINKGKFAYDKLRPWLQDGLLTSSRSKWSTRRKLLTPSFHFKILEDFIPVFNEQATILVKCLSAELNDAGGKPKVFDIYPYIAKCTLDVICETAMGKRINAQTSASNKVYIDAVNGMTEVILEKVSKPWMELPLVSFLTGISKRETECLKILHGFSKGVIQSRKAEWNKTKLEKSLQVESENDPATSNLYYGKRRKAFLDLLLEYSDEGRVLKDTDIQEEVDTFMFEGHDTTGVNLAWTILLLAMHPQYQALVHEEIDAIFGNDKERDVTTADISQMKYLEASVKESLRLYPSVPFIMREVDSNITLEDGRVIPQGVTAVVAIYYIHRHPDYYNEPLKFRPERFLEDIGKPAMKHPFAFLPFSAGPRNCIGQKFALLEEKIILTKLFRKYRFESEIDDIDKVIAVPDVVLRSNDGVRVRLYNR